MRSTPKIECPHCQRATSRVIPVNNPNHRVTRDGGVRRWRECLHCLTRYSTVERLERTIPKKGQHLGGPPT